MGELHVFKNDVIDWVIAASAEDATRVWEEHNGASWADVTGDDEAPEWVQEPDDKVLWVRDDEGGRNEKSCEAWAAELGRSFLASTEY